MRRLFEILTLTLIAAMLFGGTTLAQDASPQAGNALVTGAQLGLSEYAIEMTDDGFVAAPEIAAGRVLVTVTNNSSDAESSPFFIELAEGETIADLQAKFDAIAIFFETGEADGDPFAFLYEAHLPGGTSAEVGRAGQVIIDLTPGNYAVADLNFIKSPMPVTVTGEMPAELPAVDANATLSAVDTGDTFDYSIEGTISSGPQFVAVVNDSSQPHFTEFGKAPEGYTLTEEIMDQLIMIDMEMGTPDPALDLPQVESITYPYFVSVQSPGTTQWLVADFAPGSYVTTCWVPDPRHEGNPHSAMGMYTVFNVE